MLGPFRIEAYAIASADGMIADETGMYPKSLRFDADQRYLQESLDRTAVIVQGRNSGTGQPNWRKRLRLIMTRKVASLAPDPDNPNARFWNPAGASLEEACAAVGCTRGTVAIIGGPEVYSYFLQIGYDDFYLSRAENVYLPGGKPLFTQGRLGQKPEEVLASAGLKPGPTQRLEDGVSLVDWKPAGQKELRRQRAPPLAARVGRSRSEAALTCTQTAPTAKEVAMLRHMNVRDTAHRRPDSGSQSSLAAV